MVTKPVGLDRVQYCELQPLDSTVYLITDDPMEHCQFLTVMLLCNQGGYIQNCCCGQYLSVLSWGQVNGHISVVMYAPPFEK